MADSTVSDAPGATATGATAGLAAPNTALTATLTPDSAALTSPPAHVASRPPIETRIEVYWPVDDEHYPGVVVSYDTDGKAVVIYDDGDKEHLDLAVEVWRPEGEVRNLPAGKSPVMPPHTSTVAPTPVYSAPGSSAANRAGIGISSSAEIAHSAASAQAPSAVPTSLLSPSALGAHADSSGRQSRSDSRGGGGDGHGRKSDEEMESMYKGRHSRMNTPKRGVDDENSDKPNKRGKSAAGGVTQSEEMSGVLELTTPSQWEISAVLDVSPPCTVDANLRRPTEKEAEDMQKAADIAELKAVIEPMAKQMEDILPLGKRLEEISPLSRQVAEITPAVVHAVKVSENIFKELEPLRLEVVALQKRKKESMALYEERSKSNDCMAGRVEDLAEETKKGVEGLVSDVAELSKSNLSYTTSLNQAAEGIECISTSHHALEGTVEALTTATKGVEGALEKIMKNSAPSHPKHEESLGRSRAIAEGSPPRSTKEQSDKPSKQKSEREFIDLEMNTGLSVPAVAETTLEKSSAESTRTPDGLKLNEKHSHTAGSPVHSVGEAQ